MLSGARKFLPSFSSRASFDKSSIASSFNKNGKAASTKIIQNLILHSNVIPRNKYGGLIAPASTTATTTTITSSSSSSSSIKRKSKKEYFYSVSTTIYPPPPTLEPK